MFEREWRDLARIQRWNGMHLIQRQSVAEHSFYVAVYAEQIAQLIQWRLLNVAHLLMAALYHDVDEQASGDIRGSFKTVLPLDTKATINAVADQWAVGVFGRPIADSRTMTEAKLIINAADKLEAVLFLEIEHQLGNRTMDRELEWCVERLRKAWDQLPFSDPGLLQAGYTLICEKMLEHRGSYSKVLRKEMNDVAPGA